MLARDAPNRRDRVIRLNCFKSERLIDEKTYRDGRWRTVVDRTRGLSELGYVYGQHDVTEIRSADRISRRFPAIAAELVALQPDIVVAGEPMIAAIKAATTSIPVVMTAAMDPVAEGLVQSLRRSGNNLTGLSRQFADVAGKLLELLKEIVPDPAALLVLTGRTSFPHRQRIAELALQHRLSSLFDLRPYVESGGLISYGADLVDTWRQRVRFVDKSPAGR